MATLAYPDRFSLLRPPSELTVKAQGLLARYPDISERDLETLVRTFPYLPTIDVSLMSADQQLAEKVDAFCRDHGDKLKAPVKPLVAAVIGTGAFAVGLLWWLTGTLPGL